MSVNQLKRAIYAGTFDPPTNGHLWVIKEAAKLFDELIIGIGLNPDKKVSYSLADRVEMLESMTVGLNNTSIVTYENTYLVEFANQVQAQYIIRGIRSVADYEYERNMRYINSDIHAHITTLFLFPPREYSEVSSTLVKGLVGFENWEKIIEKYVPLAVKNKMIQKYLFQANDSL